MTVVQGLNPVNPQPGKPLYQVAKDRLLEAIDGGAFAPGEQLPSTKELSEHLSVSLVTAHRALQELVNAGVLERSQGKGTFVQQAYSEGRRTVSDVRIAVLLNRDASLVNFSIGQIAEGIRQGALSTDADLVFPRYDDDLRKQCHGVICICPIPGEVEAIVSQRRTRVIVAGAISNLDGVNSIYVDEVQMARQAVGHLTGHGHTQVGFIGPVDGTIRHHDRWQGYLQGLADRGLTHKPQWVVPANGWRMTERERSDLMRMLSSPNRPTAIFSTGYYFALDVYAAAQTLGLKIGRDLSVISVDDPPSAAYLSPSLTTVRQPLAQLGHGAVTALVESVRRNDLRVENRMLRAELVIRESTAPVGISR